MSLIVVVLAALSASWQPGAPPPDQERRIAERLAAEGDAASRMALVDFIERLQPTIVDRQAAARFALLRLRAIAAVLEALPGIGVDGADTSRVNPAVKRYVDLGEWDPFSDRWRVPHTTAFAIAAEHRGAAAADDIMWFGVTSGIGHECEGHVPCYAHAENELVGEYLRRFPNGRHADEAIDTVALIANQALRLVDDPDVFDRRTDCKDLLPPLTLLRRAVDAARAAGQPQASALLTRLAEVCR